MAYGLGVIAPGNFGSKAVVKTPQEDGSCLVDLFGSRLVDSTRHLLFHSKRRGDTAACGLAFRDKQTKVLKFRSVVGSTQCSSPSYLYRHTTSPGRPLKLYTYSISSGCAGHGLVPEKLVLRIDYPPIRPEACFILSKVSVDVNGLPIYNQDVELPETLNHFETTIVTDRYKLHEFNDLPDYFCDNPWDFVYEATYVTLYAKITVFNKKLYLVSSLQVSGYPNLHDEGVLEQFPLGSIDCLDMIDQTVFFSDSYGPLLLGRISSVGSKQGLGEACCEPFCSYNQYKESSYEVDLVISGFEIVDDDCCSAGDQRYVFYGHEGINGVHRLVITTGCFWDSGNFIRNSKYVPALIFDNPYQCEGRPRITELYIYSVVNQQYIENEKVLFISLEIFLVGPLLSVALSKTLILENRGPLRRGESFNFHFVDEDGDRATCGIFPFYATVIFK